MKTSPTNELAERSVTIEDLLISTDDDGRMRVDMILRDIDDGSVILLHHKEVKQWH